MRCENVQGHYITYSSAGTLEVWVPTRRMVRGFLYCPHLHVSNNGPLTANPSRLPPYVREFI
jgi:hypothetical protein